MEQLSVAIADDNQKILNVLGEIVSADKELDLVGESEKTAKRCVRSLKTDSRMLFFSI